MKRSSQRDYFRPWLQPWKPARKRRLSAVATRFLEKPTPEQVAWLAKKVALQAADLRTYPDGKDPEFLRLFGQTRRGRFEINDRRLVTTFAWQIVVRMLHGGERPVHGNLRSLWYRELSPLIVRLGLLDPVQAAALKGSPSGRARYLLDLLEGAMEAMFRRRFFRYSDLKVYDSMANFRKLGTRRRRFVLHTEKEGLYWLLELLWEEFGVTIIASRGSPTWVTMDFFAEELRRAGASNIVTGSITDYDPWGDDIGGQMAGKLEKHPTLGVHSVLKPRFKSVVNTPLTDLSLFDPGRVPMVRRQLLIGNEEENDPKRTAVEAWIARGGGIHGEPYGLHVDNAEPDRIQERVRRWIRDSS